MAISFNDPPQSRVLRDNECNAVINALDKNNDGVLGRNELNITNRARFERFDTNGDGQLATREAKTALMNDELNIGLGRNAAVQVLLKFDSNQDGYLGAEELTMNRAMINQCDGYGSNKYSYENAQLAYDQKGRIRETGAARQDGRVSVSELANVMADGQLRVGREIGLPKYF